MKTTGQRFKEIRQSLDLSQQEFGSKLGITSQGISNIEKNKSFLTLDKMQALKEFNVNLNFLVYGDGEMFNNKVSNDKFIIKSREEFEQLMLELLRKNKIIK